MKRLIRRIPIVGPLATRVYRSLIRTSMPAFRGDSAEFWEQVYANGGHSGDGSYGVLSRYKADVINEFVVKHDVRSVIEFGCGDGSQLRLARYPRYLGLDVSPTAVAWCRSTFSRDGTKRFELVSEYANETADLALSLDVVYHITEDDVFTAYMRRLFDAAQRFVIIYSSNFEEWDGGHVRHRRFTDWIDAHAPTWRLMAHHINPHSTLTTADLYIYGR